MPSASRGSTFGGQSGSTAVDGRPTFSGALPPTHPHRLTTPDGFAGQLRGYQAEAAGWLGFLDRAGLGGCLAMDMGLGKTPTVLAACPARSRPRADAW